jgi:hypothetical protein
MESNIVLAELQENLKTLECKDEGCHSLDVECPAKAHVLKA